MNAFEGNTCLSNFVTSHKKAPPIFRLSILPIRILQEFHTEKIAESYPNAFIEAGNEIINIHYCTFTTFVNNDKTVFESREKYVTKTIYHQILPPLFKTVI